MAVVVAIVALLVLQRSPRCAVGRSVGAQRAAVVSGRMRCVSWERWTRPAHRRSRLRHRSAGFHRLRPHHSRSRSRLAVGRAPGRPRSRVRSHDARVRRRAYRGADPPGDRSCPHVLRRAWMAARRSEPAAAVRHRKSVSRERSGPHHDRLFQAASARSAISFCTSIVSAGAANTKCSCRSTCASPQPAHGRPASGTSAPRTSTCCTTACRAGRSCQREERSRCRPAASRKVSATGSRCSRRSAPSARCFRATDFSTRTPASKCRPMQNGPRRRRSGGSRSARPSWQNRWGRAWSPMVEILGARELEDGSEAEWDVLPQVQVSLSTRQHVLLNIGVRTPISQRRERRTRRPRLSAVGLVRRRILLGMVMRYSVRHVVRGVRRVGDRTRSGIRTRTSSRRRINAWRVTTVCARHRARMCRSARRWRASMMANSSRDPYWQAAVRREVLDHPAAADAIQDECATCHMPMSRTDARLNGDEGEVFEHLPVRDEGDRSDRLAHDGVACSLCHQITDRNLGTPASFTGGYVVSPRRHAERRVPMFGPFKIERGMTTIMRSATGFQPTEAVHVRQSELCATCHTLVTKARGPKGEVIGELPEQMPFQEWQHSAYAGEQRSCQSCHMPVGRGDTPIASVLGRAAQGFARHTFIGGNVFMQRMLNRYRGDLGVARHAGRDGRVDRRDTGQSSEIDRRTVDRSQPIDRAAGCWPMSACATSPGTSCRPVTRRAARGCTSRFAIERGRVVFESGAVAPNGAIAGNDNDADALAVRAASHRDPHAGSGADLRVGHERLDRTSDDRPSDGRAVPQRQSPGAERI